MKILFNLRKSIYLSLGLFDQLIGKRNDLIVLCYHSINRDGWRYGVSLSELKKQIEFLSQRYEFISTADLQNLLSGKKILERPSVVITFDDGYKDILSTVDFFSKEKINPTVFVIANAKRADRTQLQTNRDLLSASDIKQLQKNGWIIGNHSMTHVDFNKLDSDQMLSEEIINSKRVLEQNIDTKVNFFAYPKGIYNGLVLAAAQKAGYKAAFSMDDGLITSKTHHLIIPRVGVDRTHSFNEFKYLASPSVIAFRRLVKKFIGGML
jgi:peptidoglycan/xylan/chitin deacetylase (PgdA/CDA1 family)